MNRVFAALNMLTISSSTFYRHAQQFLQPAILSVWIDRQTNMIETLRQRPGDVIIGGDMRADSPGHCAKYGSYTIMELRANRIIHIGLIQVCVLCLENFQFNHFLVCYWYFTINNCF